MNQSSASGIVDNQRSDGGLSFARVLWPLTALLVIVLFTLGIPVYYRQLQMVDACTVCGFQRLTQQRANDVRILGVSLEFYAAYFVAVEILLALVYPTVATMIFIRASRDRVALLAAFMLLTWGASFTNILDVSGDKYPWAWLPVGGIQMIGAGSFYLFFSVFADGRLVPRWIGWFGTQYAETEQAGCYPVPGIGTVRITNPSEVEISCTARTVACRNARLCGANC